jgi:hypothetical protein
MRASTAAGSNVFSIMNSLKRAGKTRKAARRPGKRLIRDSRDD